MTEDKFLRWLGMILMIVGGLAIFSSFAGTLFSTVGVSAGPVEVTGLEIDNKDVLRMAVGVLLFFLGYFVYRKRLK